MQTQNPILSHLIDFISINPTFKDFKFVITGSSGFLGSNLLIAMESIGLSGYAVDLKPINKNQSNEHKFKNFKFLKVDLTSKIEVNNLFKKLPSNLYFIHLASPNTERSVKENTLNKKNFQNFSSQTKLEICIAENIIQAMEKKIKFFIYTSSIDVYGSIENKHSIVDENTPPNPDSPYSFGKLFSENIYRNELSIPLTILRLPQIYGDYEHIFYHRAIPHFLQSAHNDIEINITGSLEEHRFYLHCNDVLLAILKSILMKSNNIFIIAGKKISLKMLLKTIYEVTQKPLKYNTLSGKKNARYQYDINSSKAKSYINFCQTISLEEGLNSSLNIIKQEEK